jgi:hypothetical protein
MHLAWTLHGTNGAHKDVAIMILNVIKVEEILKEFQGLQHYGWRFAICCMEEDVQHND